MAKIIRPTYPIEFSIGLLLLIFMLSTFLSFEIFNVKWRLIMEGEGPIFGMVLSGTATVIMALILWEEFLFPVRVKPETDQVVFRNHATKLKTQVLIYCAIPLVVIFIFVNYEVSWLPFFVWAAICLLAPVVGKLVSGIKNYNDFLKLTNEAIQFKNNTSEGFLPINEIREILLIRDESNLLQKLKVLMLNNSEVMIDLDEMELEAYFETIERFIMANYRWLVSGIGPPKR